MDLPIVTDLGEAMLGDPQAHGREVKDLPARSPGADVLARELTLADPALLRRLLDDRQAALERLARVPRLSATRFALGLRQRRTRSLLVIASLLGGRCEFLLVCPKRDRSSAFLRSSSSRRSRSSSICRAWVSNSSCRAYTSEGIFALLGES